MRNIFRPWAVPALCVLAFALVPACSDDPAGPGKNGGTPANNLMLSAGSYHVLLDLWECGSVDTLTVEVDEIVCASTALSDILEIDCPIQVNGDSLVIQCTQTRTDGAGCTYSQLFSGRGVKTATTWEISGTYTLISESTPDCSGEPACGEFHVFIDRTGSAPASCVWGTPGTVTMTVTGGPLAGKRVMEAGGSSFDNLDGTIQFSFGGFYDSSDTRSTGGEIGTFQDLYIFVPSVDPSALPQTINVQVTGLRRVDAAGGGGNDASLSYGEYRDSPLHSFFAETGTGTMVVHEASMEGIAGTFSFNSMGPQTNSGGTTSVSRSATALFNVPMDSGPIPPKSSFGWRK